MTTIPIPEGLEIPQEPQFEMPVVFEIVDDQLVPLAVGGIALAAEEMPEEMPEEAPESDASFSAAVERAMGTQPR